jgi:hypothetical protein
MIGHAPDCGLYGDAECTCPKRLENLAADEARAHREDRERAVDRVLAGVRRRALEVIALRDDHGWPEPRTVHELRSDPRVQLRNRINEPAELEALELAAALIVAVDATRWRVPT